MALGTDCAEAAEGGRLLRQSQTIHPSAISKELKA